jgi:hypothetical protein
MSRILLVIEDKTGNVLEDLKEVGEISKLSAFIGVCTLNGIDRQVLKNQTFNKMNVRYLGLLSEWAEIVGNGSSSTLYLSIEGTASIKDIRLSLEMSLDLVPNTWLCNDRKRWPGLLMEGTGLIGYFESNAAAYSIAIKGLLKEEGRLAMNKKREEEGEEFSLT